MPTGNRLRLIKGVLYRLKRSFGCPLTVYQQNPENVDLETGRASITRTSYEIRQAIVLPSKIHRGFTYDIGFLKANSNFTYGGIYTDAIRQVIIDRKDLPVGLELDSTDQFYIVYSGQRWELKAVEEIEYKLAYTITLARVDGAVLNQIVNLNVRDRLEFDETIGGGDSEIQFLNPVDILTFNQTVTVGPITHRQQVIDSLDFNEEINDTES